MLIKFFHYLWLFAYLNVIVYEAAFIAADKQPMLEGNALVENVIGNIIDIPEVTGQEVTVPNEEYRFLKRSNHMITAIVLVLCFFLGRRLFSAKITEHPFYKTKSFCLPGYYSFLFRFKPF